MNRVVVDNLTRSRLENLGAALELCDESGATLGYFVPVSENDRALYTQVQKSVMDEELQRAFDEPGGFTLREILAELQSK